MHPRLFLSSVLTLASVILSLLSLLSPHAPSAHAAPQIEPPILRLSMESEPLSLDWQNPRTPSDRFIASFLMRGLLRYGSGATLVCDLCTQYQISADGKTLTFELPAGLLWSDDIELEAQHFVDSFKRLLDPANHLPAAKHFDAIEGADGKKWDPKKLGVRAVQRTRLEITLSRPSALFPHFLTTPPAFPVRKEFLKAKKDNWEEHAMMAVLGPYQLAAWEQGRRIVIEGNGNNKVARPVYRVEFIVGSHAQQVSRFKAGKLDILSLPTTEDILKLQNPKVQLQVNPYWASRILLLNSKSQALQQLSLRKAILHALEREQLPAVLKSGERRTTGLVPPGLTGARDLPLATVNLELAQTERKSGGPAKAELKLLVLDTGLDRQVAQWLSEQLRRINIQVTIAAKRPAELQAELARGGFDLALRTWAFEIASPLEILQPFATGAPGNAGRWTNVGFDALLTQLIQEQQKDRFATLLDQALQVLEVQDVGVIPLGYPTQPFLLGPRVIRFATTPFGDPDLVQIQLK